MKIYKINIQFADPNSPDFDDSTIMPVLEKAITNYNTKSLIAKNPKKITGKTIVDPRTLQLVLQSESELPFPSKALRLFSAYLVDPDTEGALNQYIYGKQLFKMAAEEITEAEHPNNKETGNDVNALRIKVISLIVKASEAKLIKILEVLEEEKSNEKQK
ncbi:hypothetical protein [Ruminococcus sp. zg-924]|nr:hypothetical protein [Ruminococcus sp. zg-924]MCQ4022490.1 hypothetical protein [Ruminococcus sp. zg-924]MCQ4115167.1 hypothetical protein [Ruminococcus sp. zg-921]